MSASELSRWFETPPEHSQRETYNKLCFFQALNQCMKLKRFSFLIFSQYFSTSKSCEAFSGLKILPFYFSGEEIMPNAWI